MLNRVVAALIWAFKAKPIQDQNSFNSNVKQTWQTIKKPTFDNYIKMQLRSAFWHLLHNHLPMNKEIQIGRMYSMRFA